MCDIAAASLAIAPDYVETGTSLQLPLRVPAHTSVASQVPQDQEHAAARQAPNASGSSQEEILGGAAGGPQRAIRSPSGQQIGNLGQQFGHIDGLNQELVLVAGFVSGNL